MKIAIPAILTFLMHCNLAFSQSTNAKIILLLPQDSTQFFTDVNYADFISDTVDLIKVSKEYSNELSYTLISYNYPDFIFLLPGKSSLDSIRNEQSYATLKAKNGENYLGIVPKTPEQSMLHQYMERYKIDYVLSINLYEVFYKNEEKVDFLHVIHYDYFDKNLTGVDFGKFVSEDFKLFGGDVYWMYQDLAMDIIFKTNAFEKKGDFKENYTEEIKKFEYKEYGLSEKMFFGLEFGLNGPYGGVGGELAYFPNESFDLNAGIGYDYGGVKLGGGFRWYFNGYDRKHKPFMGAGLSVNSGGKFYLKAEYDEFGNISNPSDLSEYRMEKDICLHLRFGKGWVFDGNAVVMTTLGYGFPFKKSEPELVSGKYKKGRENYAKFVAPGGLELTITVLFRN